MRLLGVAQSYDSMINGVAVAPNGRVFSSFPRWTDNPTPGVAEVLPDGSFRPFPGGGWNDALSDRDPAQQFLAVHSIHADAGNHLWVVDDAAPHQRRDESVRPKLVDIDLATNNVDRVFPIDTKAAPAGAILGHVRATRDHAFVTDSAYGAIIIVDRSTGQARRVLSKHPKTQADPSITPIVDGEPFQKANGEPIVVHANLIEVMDDWLYFTCLFGPILRRVKLSSILDSTITDAELGSLVEDIARIPPCAGLMRGSEGRLYISAFSENAILCLDQNGLHTVIQNSRLCFPNEGSLGPDNWLYVPASQANRISMHQTDGISRVRLPWEILKIDLAAWQRETA